MDKTEAQEGYSPSHKQVQVLTLDDIKGKELYDKLPDTAKDHLRRFALSRPGFDMVMHGSLMFDEKPMVPGIDFAHRADPVHQYQAGTIYIVGKLKMAPRPLGTKVIDIGSPIEQNIATAALDQVELTVIDIRPNWRPDILPFQQITASATQIPLPDECADYVTSNCVMCHVGDGRYGDPFDVDGDVNMLREIKRILKKGHRAFVGIGPMHRTANMLFNVHRVYSPEWAEKLFKWAGLIRKDFLVYNLFDGVWCTPDLMSGKTRGQFYGFVSLERPAW